MAEFLVPALLRGNEKAPHLQRDFFIGTAQVTTNPKRYNDYSSTIDTSIGASQHLASFRKIGVDEQERSTFSLSLPLMVTWA
jgi:hypothetical protein